MLGSGLRSFYLPISFSEFERLPRNPAYKYEYFGGRAVLTPRPRYRRAILDLNALRPPNSGSRVLATASLRSLQPNDWTCLPELLAAAFRTVPPLVTLDADVRPSVAHECMEHTQAGGHGPVVEPACFAVEARETKGLAGAIVVTLIPGREQNRMEAQRPHLTWVLVHPSCFGQGLGSALLACAVKVLRELGFRDLASTFLLGNDRAALWHWRRGFRLVPDPPPVVPPHRNEAVVPPLPKGEGHRG